MQQRSRGRHAASSTSTRRRPIRAVIPAFLAVLVAVLLPAASPAAVAAASAQPIGNFESFSVDPVLPVTYNLRGWAYDPDDPSASITVHIYQYGDYGGVEGIAVVTANQPRPDVNAAFGITGAHGWEFQLTQTGNYGNQVCAHAIDVGGPGVNPRFGCRAVSYGGVAHGALDTFQFDGSQVTVSGWAVESGDTTLPMNVVLRDETVGFQTTFATGVPRPDVAAAFPGAGPNQGFAASVPIARSPGEHRVCVWGASQYGLMPLLGCRIIQVTAAPGADRYIGSVDRLAIDSGGMIRAQGWVIDRANPTTTSLVTFDIDNSGSGGSSVAAGDRPDVGAAYPSAGSLHGFDASQPSSAAGVHRVCLNGVNTPSPGGTQGLLGCLPISADTPFGTLDSVTNTADGTVVKGWAIDPANPSTPLSVFVVAYRIDESGDAVRYFANSFAYPADADRPDIAAVYGVDPRHGYDVTVPGPADLVRVLAIREMYHDSWVVG